MNSKDLRKALAGSPKSSARLVAVGYDFTEEARALVDVQNGLLFSERSFFRWTDESCIQLFKGEPPYPAF